MKRFIKQEVEATGFYKYIDENKDEEFLFSCDESQAIYRADGTEFISHEYFTCFCDDLVSTGVHEIDDEGIVIQVEEKDFRKFVGAL